MLANKSDINNKRLVKLLASKHLWEDRRDKLCNRILWDYQRNAFLFLLITLKLLFFYSGGDTFKWKEGNKWLSAIWIILMVVSLFFWWFTLVRNTFNCYYKLPYYRQKINDLDHQIIEVLFNWVKEGNKKIPFWLYHNYYDNIVPAQVGDQSAELLKQKGYQAEFDNLYNGDHFFCSEELEEIITKKLNSLLSE